MEVSGQSHSGGMNASIDTVSIEALTSSYYKNKVSNEC